MMRTLSLPIRNPGFLKLFIGVTPLLLVVFLGFMQPGKLDASDFMLIAWNPGHSLLTTGAVYEDYPYPLWTVIVMLPFTIWQPQIGMILWFICNVLMLSASLALIMSLFDWELSPIWFAVLTLISGFFLPVLTSLWLGQLTIFSLLILALTIYLFLHRKWIWLGIILGLSFIKPQAMILLAGLLLLWALIHRRWDTLISFGGVITLLTLTSIPFISSPSQIVGGGISSHLATYIQRTSTIWGLFLTLGFPLSVPLVISLILLAWLGWIWIPLIFGKLLTKNRVVFLFAMATIINLAVIPYSWMHNLSLLLLPLAYNLTLLLKFNIKTRGLWFALLLIVMHPLMLGVFVLVDYTQSYQIVSALIILFVMFYLETQSSRRGI